MAMVEDFSAQRSFVVRDFLLKGRLSLDIFCSKVVCHWRFLAHRWLWLEISCSLMAMVGDFSAQWSFVGGDFLLKGCLWLEIFCPMAVCLWRFFAQWLFVFGDFMLIYGCGWRFSAQRWFVVGDVLLKGCLSL